MQRREQTNQKAEEKREVGGNLFRVGLLTLRSDKTPELALSLPSFVSPYLSGLVDQAPLSNIGNKINIYRDPAYFVRL